MSAKSHIDAAWRARARVPQALDRVKTVPQLAALQGANVAILRQMRGKVAKSLRCNDIKFNIIHVMRLSADPAPNRCRNARFDPPFLSAAAGAKAHVPRTHPRKNFPHFYTMEC